MNNFQFQQSLHDFLSSLPPELAVWLPLLAIVIGVGQCFFGWRVFKVVLGVSGFLSAALLVGMFVFSFTNSVVITLLAAIFAGVIGAVMLVIVYFFGMFFFGAAMGVLIGYLGFSLAKEVPWITVLFILGCVGGITTLVYQRFMIIFSTAVIGATLAVVGGLWYSTAGFVPFSVPRLDVMLQQHFATSITAGALLIGMGIFVQYWFKPGQHAVTSRASASSPDLSKTTKPGSEHN